MDDRAWMYTGWKCGGQLSEEWIDKTETFLDGAFAKLKRGNTTWCPCNKCGNTRRQTREVMTNHLCNYGFTRDYTRWTYHGEANGMRNEVIRQRIEEHDTDAGVADMLDDFHEAHFDEGRREEEEPEATAKMYYDMLVAAQQPLHGHTKVSQLDEAVLELSTVAAPAAAAATAELCLYEHALFV